MNVRPIIDAGPALNFLSVNKERLLIAVLGELSAPEIVQDEVLRKSQQDARFLAAATVWRKLTPRWIQILSDDATPELATVVQRVSGLSMDERRRQPKDLGETMVIAHAVVAAESGRSVTILMDDGPGATIATSEISRLRRPGSSRHPRRPPPDRVLLPQRNRPHDLTPRHRSGRRPRAPGLDPHSRTSRLTAHSHRADTAGQSGKRRRSGCGPPRGGRIGA